MTKRLLLTLLCFYSVTLFAQQAPTGVIPTYYNGGFAGEAGAPRISTFSSLTAYRGNSQVSTYGNYVSYDNFFKKIRSGVSLTVGHLNQNNGTAYQLRSRFMTVAISPKFSFNGKYTLAPFVRFNLSGGLSELRSYSSGDVWEAKWLSGGMSSGVLFNSSKWYVGFTVGSRELQHTFYNENNYPDAFPTNNNTYWTPTLNWSFQAGYTFQRTPDSKFSFTPQIVLTPFRSRSTTYHTIGGVTHVHNDESEGVVVNDMNLMFRYKKFIAGVNVQGIKLGSDLLKEWTDPDITVGYQTKNFKILLNQNYSKGGIYEGKVGIRYLFPKSAENGPVSIR